MYARRWPGIRWMEGPKTTDPPGLRTPASIPYATAIDSYFTHNGLSLNDDIQFRLPPVLYTAIRARVPRSRLDLSCTGTDLCSQILFAMLMCILKGDSDFDIRIQMLRLCFSAEAFLVLLEEVKDLSHSLDRLPNASSMIALL